MTLDAIQKARLRRQTGALGTLGREGGKEQFQAGTIIIGGVSYACAAHLGKIEYRMDGGTGLWRQIQPLMVTIQKALLATAPAKREEITFVGNRYQVDDVGGQNVVDLVWLIKADRMLPLPA